MQNSALDSFFFCCSSAFGGSFCSPCCWNSFTLRLYLIMEDATQSKAIKNEMWKILWGDISTADVEWEVFQCCWDTFQRGPGSPRRKGHTVQRTVDRTGLVGWFMDKKRRLKKTEMLAGTKMLARYFVNRKELNKWCTNVTQFHSSAWRVAAVAVARTRGAVFENCFSLARSVKFMFKLILVRSLGSVASLESSFCCCVWNSLSFWRRELSYVGICASDECKGGLHMAYCFVPRCRSCY